MVTIADVARHAGVAASTVSYVLSGKRTISTDTRERVQRSVRALGYRPNASARALASQRSNVLALVIPLRTGMHVPVMMQFAAAVVTTARRYDHDVLLLTADEGPEGLERVAQSSLVDALVVMDIELDDERVPVLRELPMPSMLIGYPDDADGLTCIDLDFVAAGAHCVDHLADLGHRSLALLGTPSAVYERQTGFAQRTLTGFAEAAERRGVVGLETPCEHTFDAILHTVVSCSTSTRTSPAWWCRTSRSSDRSWTFCAGSAAGSPTTCRWWRSARTTSPSGRFRSCRRSRSRRSASATRRSSR